MKFEVEIDTDISVAEVKIAIQEQLRIWQKFKVIREWDVKLIPLKQNKKN